MDGVVMPSGASRLRTRLCSAAGVLRQHVRHDRHTYPRGRDHKVMQEAIDQDAKEGKGLVRSASAASRLNGNLSRALVTAWTARVGSRDQGAPLSVLQPLFSDLHLYPTKKEVFEMLVCARSCAKRSSHTLSFGEFCVIAAELRRNVHKRPSSWKSVEDPSSSPSISSACVDPQREGAAAPSAGDQTNNCVPESNAIKNGSGVRPPPSSSSSSPPYEVFLGGSCNPTTWRSDLAMPMLDDMGITYFNPQVANWSLDLVEVEHAAKQSARVLLFVLDPETRGVSAAIEAAYLAAARRALVLVLQPHSRGSRISGEPVLEPEYRELARGRALLQELAERRDLPVFTELPAALACTQLLLRGKRALRPPHKPVASHLMKLLRTFESADISHTGSLSPSQAASALQSILGSPVPQGRLLHLMQTLSPHQTAEQEPKMNFELFCTVLAELVNESLNNEEPNLSTASLERSDTNVEVLNGHKNSVSSRSNAADSKEDSKLDSTGDSGGTSETDTPKAPNKAAGRKLSVFIPKLQSDGLALTPQSSRLLEGLAGSVRSSDSMRDVYLGGFCEMRPNSRESIVIPKLQHHNRSFFVPSINDYSRMFSAPPYTPAGGAKFTFEETNQDIKTQSQEAGKVEIRQDRAPPRKIERQTSKSQEAPKLSKRETEPGSKSDKQKFRDSLDSDHPEKKFKREEDDEEPELRRSGECGPYPLSSGGDNRLSASDFYRITDSASPAPFKGMYDEAMLDRSRVLLFAVLADCRGVASMVLAGHCVRLRPRACVLCLQTIQPDTIPGVTKLAASDYNRARHYLADLAKRENVTVYESLEEATDAVLGKLQRGDY